MVELEDTLSQQNLRVVSSGGQVGRIAGNPHTHPGRFSVLWDGEVGPVPTSLSELSEATDEARCWLAGFLAGQGPHPLEIAPHGADYLSEEDTLRWSEVHREFERTGRMPDAWRKNRAAFEGL